MLSIYSIYLSTIYILTSVQRSCLCPVETGPQTLRQIVEMYGLTGFMRAGDEIYLCLFIFRFSHFPPSDMKGYLTVRREQERALARIPPRHVLGGHPVKEPLLIVTQVL